MTGHTGYTIRQAAYDLRKLRGKNLITKPGRPDVDGWSRCTLRSTEGFVRHSLGSTIEHYGLGGTAAYWRKS